ncbi:MAG TPA: hypothetical protein VEG62_03195 [Acidimicrobiales bacterium]|nr:hypothetical protein [Acidimicrobiales bacterium]
MSGSAGAPPSPGGEELEHRRQTAARTVLLGTIGFVASAALVGLVVGLSAASAGWGLAAGAAFVGLGLVAAAVALAAQDQLRGAGRLYGQAMRQAVSGGWRAG